MSLISPTSLDHGTRWFFPRTPPGYELAIPNVISGAFRFKDFVALGPNGPGTGPTWNGMAYASSFAVDTPTTLDSVAFSLARTNDPGAVDPPELAADAVMFDLCDDAGGSPGAVLQTVSIPFASLVSGEVIDAGPPTTFQVKLPLTTPYTLLPGAIVWLVMYSALDLPWPLDPSGGEYWTHTNAALVSPDPGFGYVGSSRNTLGESLEYVFTPPQGGYQPTGRYLVALLRLGQDASTPGVWYWGYRGINQPQQLGVYGFDLNGVYGPLAGEEVVKVVPYRSGTPAVDPFAVPALYFHGFTALSSAGNVYVDESGGPRNLYRDANPDPLFPTLSDLVPGLPQGTITDIDIGQESTYALDNLGNLWAWSAPPLYSNASSTGETGPNPALPLDQYGVNRSLVPFVTLTNVGHVKAGLGYTIAQKLDGTWWATGVLGDGADGLSRRIIDGSLDGSFSSGDSNFWPEGYVWTEVASLEALDTVKVVTGNCGNGRISLFVQRNGDVWAAGESRFLFDGPVVNMTGINYGQYLSFCDFAGPFLGVHQDPAVYFPIQIPWASGIVDASIADSIFALYLTSAGDVYFVFNNTNIYGGGPLKQLAADGTLLAPSQQVLVTPTIPPLLTLPPGVVCSALLPGGGGLIGSDGRLYTLGLTPDGSLDDAGILAYNLAQQSGQPLPFSLDGTHFNELPYFGNVGQEFVKAGPDPSTLADPQPAWAGVPPPALASNHLSGVKGGFATFGYRVMTVNSGGPSQGFGPSFSRVVAFLAFLRRGAINAWGRVVGPI